MSAPPVLPVIPEEEMMRLAPGRYYYLIFNSLFFVFFLHSVKAEEFFLSRYPSSTNSEWLFIGAVRIKKGKHF